MTICTEIKEVDENPISTVTLELSSVDAEKLSVAKSMGNINLVLRSAVSSTLPQKNNGFTSDLFISNTLINIVPSIRNRGIIF